jgi:Fur family ferric uptake transcriptional regulator
MSSSTATDPKERLRSVGLRVTAPRLAVLHELERLAHADADALAAAVRTHHHAVSTQAVYDVLRVLTERGLTRRIEPSGSTARYENRVGDNHHHLVCRRCGDIADVECVVGAAPCLDPADTNGFTVDEAEVVFWGMCPTCRANPPSDPSHTEPPSTKEQ